ncbi:MAG: acyltransferase [Mycobacterium sp.]
MREVLVPRGQYHPLALVESDAIGEGTRVWAWAHVMPGARIGKNCNIGDHAFIEGGSTLGDGVTVKNGVLIWEGVTIGDGVFVGPGVLFTNDRTPRSTRMELARRPGDPRSWLTPTFVEAGASLGAGAVIVAGVRIGGWALVGAGAVVTQDVPAHALVAGNPARQLGWVCHCATRLTFGDGRAKCPTCGRWYVESADGPVLDGTSEG